MTNLEIIGDSCLPESDLIKLARLICETEDPAHSYQICLKIANSKEMKHYNRIYRGVDKNTDILSFVNSELPFAIDAYDKDAETEKKRPVRLCDIIIDINQLTLQKGNKTLEQEFRIVLIHGLLHLVGYDHIRKLDTSKMEIKENHYLKMLQGE